MTWLSKVKGHSVPIHNCYCIFDTLLLFLTMYRQLTNDSHHCFEFILHLATCILQGFIFHTSLLVTPLVAIATEYNKWYKQGKSKFCRISVHLSASSFLADKIWRLIDTVSWFLSNFTRREIKVNFIEKLQCSFSKPYMMRKVHRLW